MINSKKIVLQEERINIQIKYTIPQHTTKVGIIVGYNLEYVNTKYIEQKLLEKVKYTKHLRLNMIMYMKKIFGLSI